MMTDQKKPKEIADEALEDAQGGLIAFGNDTTTLKRQRTGDGLNSFGNDGSTLVDDDAQDSNLVSFGAETTP